MDLAKEVSVKERYEWRSSVWCLKDDGHAEIPASELPYHVVAFDYGVKYNILRMLVARGCRVTVLPAQTPASEALALNPTVSFWLTVRVTPILRLRDQGDPASARNRHSGVRIFVTSCWRRSGATTVKMPNGHHGANHPVQDLKSGVVMITSQNHGFAVDEASLPANACDTVVVRVPCRHRAHRQGCLQLPGSP